MRSPLRWAGSKRQIAPTLRAFWSDTFSRYIEPFAGSACLFFEIKPARALLGDLNWELISALQQIRDNPHELVDRLQQFPVGEKAYYAIRRAVPQRMSALDVAARFLYLNRYCFNGLYRTNRAGTFNVPYGPPKSGLGIDRDLLFAASAALQSADLVRGDFQTTADKAEPGDFVYMDPPYVVAQRRVFAEYCPQSFAVRDLIRLADTIASLHARNVHFLVSYADCAEARKLFCRWSPRRVRTRRNIAGFAGSRRNSYELLASNAALLR